MPPEDPSIFDTVTSSERMLEWVEEGQATLSQIIAGTQQAIKDFNVTLVEDASNGGSLVQRFATFYRNRNDGREYFSDVANPRKLAAKILQRGKLKNDTEWYLLKELTTAADQTLFTPAETDTIDRMLATYETGARPD